LFITNINDDIERVSLRPFQINFLDKNKVIDSGVHKIIVSPTKRPLSEEICTINCLDENDIDNNEITLNYKLKNNRISQLSDYFTGILTFDKLKSNLVYKDKNLNIPYTIEVQFFYHKIRPRVLYLLCSKSILQSIKLNLADIFLDGWNAEIFPYKLDVQELVKSIEVNISNITVESDNENSQRLTITGIKPDEENWFNDNFKKANWIKFKGHIPKPTGDGYWYVHFSEDGGIYTNNKVNFDELITFHRESVLGNLILNDKPIKKRD